MGIVDSAPPVRVLIVDDSPVARRLVERVLMRAGIDVVAELSDGSQVVVTAQARRVEVVVLDVDMPGRSGYEVVADILEANLEVGILIYSGASNDSLRPLHQTVTTRLPCRTVSKGTGAGGGIDGLSERLVPLVEELAIEFRQRPGRSGSSPRPAGRNPWVDAAANLRAPEGPPRPSIPPMPPKLSVGSSAKRAANCSLVVIGASTGGPDALRRVLEELPADLPVPVAIVQHMPVGFTGQLASRLDTQCAVEVREAQDGEILKCGTVLIAPGGKHLELRPSGSNLRAHLTLAEPENSCRPAVDVLFRTAAQLRRESVLAVVLTGMGHDGLAGMGDVHAAGGRSIAQDEATSVVWGMPGAVIKAGLIDLVLPLAEIGPRIVEHVARGGSSRRVD